VFNVLGRQIYSMIMQTLVDIDIFAHVQRIEQALQSHSCSEALAWCSENKAALRKAKVCVDVDA
jgi:macrophage erythroblast attacher